MREQLTREQPRLEQIAKVPLSTTNLLEGSPPRDLVAKLTDLERRAHRCDVDICYVGMAPLFAETRLLVGSKRNWVVMPVNIDPTLYRGRLPVPTIERERLVSLADAGCHFPAIYSAHEVRPDADPAGGAGTSRSISRHTAADLVGPLPPSAHAVDRGQRLGALTARIGRCTARTLPYLGALAALPLLAALAPLSLLAAAGPGAGLDPVIFGVVSESGRIQPGEMAAWVLLAQWTW